MVVLVVMVVVVVVVAVGACLSNAPGKLGPNWGGQREVGRKWNGRPMVQKSQHFDSEKSTFWYQLS